MSFKDTIQVFRESQSALGFPEEQVDEALYIAFNAALVKTVNESDIEDAQAKFKQFIEETKNMKELPEDPMTDPRTKLVINKSGETFGDAFTKNFEDLLRQIEQEAKSPR